MSRKRNPLPYSINMYLSMLPYSINMYLNVAACGAKYWKPSGEEGDVLV